MTGLHTELKIQSLWNSISLAHSSLGLSVEATKLPKVPGEDQYLLQAQSSVCFRKETQYHYSHFTEGETRDTGRCPKSQVRGRGEWGSIPRCLVGLGSDYGAALQSGVDPLPRNLTVPLIFMGLKELIRWAQLPVATSLYRIQTNNREVKGLKASQPWPSHHQGTAA